MNGYAKLHSNIITSSLWTSEDDATRLLWVTMLALADSQGRVIASVPGLAHLARIPIQKAEEALERFKLPDKWSRTKEHDGRRIEEIEGGWRLLNYAKYREGRDPDARREQVREAVQRHRERNREAATGQGKPAVSQCNPSKAQADAEAEAEAEEQGVGESAPPSRPPRTAKKPEPPDDEAWLATLEADPTYTGINIRVELGKMRRWCETKNRKPSRARLISWLNRVERPMQGASDTQPGLDYSKGF